MQKKSAPKKSAPKKAIPKKSAPKKKGSPKPTTPVGMKSDMEYQAEDDVRTLARAEEIKQDKKRLERAQEMAAQKAKAMEKVAKS